MDDWKSYWKEQLELINQHINLDCDPENHDYCWISKGIIVADDATGEYHTHLIQQTLPLSWGDQ